MWEEKLVIDPPYDFVRVLERLSIDPLKAVNIAEGTVKVPLYDKKKQPFAVTVHSIGTKLYPQFIIKGEKEKQKEIAIHEVKRIFQWDINLNDVRAHFSKSNLAQIFLEHEGTPLVLDFHLYHCLIKCIIHQQLNLAFAHKLTERFVHQFGQKMDGVWFDPTPEEVASLTYSDLRELQFSGRKAEYLIDISKLIAEGSLDLEALKHMTDEEIFKKLLPIRGIGPWTVQNILLFGLGRPNLFPKADIGIQNAMKKHFGLEKKPSPDEMDELSKEWSPYLSYASLYLWRSIE
ncbi:DNA-3-methyladenine glycosylase family protein [Metabacillus arenae]|uniref:DNA-3-methyladenine glycosylase II n=1 Tax=Metabacillus arenae TaxID=2771434 RepID=A0A926NDR4_9BACI|nr:DNA-3-methyladenine glycosylase [Metabacillus arenae]MBD1379629.1 DNA-3-methyladenine glycosylase 2 family protein [Metabacillus arenae]